MSTTGNYLDLIDHCQMNIVMLYLVIVFFSGNPFQKRIQMKHFLGQRNFAGKSSSKGILLFNQQTELCL